MTATIGNLFGEIPGELPGELVEVLAKGPGVRIERIVSRGHASPAGSWYDQEQDEWVVLLQGRARLVFEHRADPVELGPGGYLLIPAHGRHRVAWTDPEQDAIWLAVHFAT